MSKHKHVLFTLFQLLDFIQPCWHLAAELQEYQPPLNHPCSPGWKSTFTCLFTAEIQIQSLESWCVLSAKQLPVLSDPAKSLLHGSGSSPDLAESCWKNSPAPALCSGVETIPWLRSLDEMREIEFHFLPSVCIKLLLIFADSVLQLFHFVGFYERTDFNFFNFFFNKQSWIPDKWNAIPWFHSLCCEQHCKHPDKDKIKSSLEPNKPSQSGPDDIVW